MTRVATRFAGALVALLAAAAALRVGVLHRARGEDPCASPGAIKATSLIPGAVALGERLEALDAQTIQWSEGEIANPALAGTPMQFQIVRSYHAPALYANPLSLAVWGRGGAGREAPETGRGSGMQPEDLRLREVAAAGATLPVHVAWDHTGAPSGPSRLVAWFYVFDNAPVRSPLSAQLAASLDLALGGPRPLTLVMVSALGTERTTGPVEDAAAEWLGAAWAYIARSCAPR